MGLMGALLALLLALVPAWARAGSAFAGMGGVGVGIADTSCELSDNPAAAAAANVDRSEGVVHLGGGMARLTFAGRVYNVGMNTANSFSAVYGLGWSAVSPVVNEGRLGLGVWQVDRHVLDVREPLDRNLSRAPGEPPLAASYDTGTVHTFQDEGLYAAGATWIQPLFDGDSQVAAGVLYLNQTGRGLLEVKAEETMTGNTGVMRTMRSRRTMNGFGAIAGYFYRPLPDGSLGVCLTYLGPLAGRVWEQDEGGPLLRDSAQRPAQMRLSVGGSFKVATGLIVAVDMRYAGEMKGTATLFAGTSSARPVNETSDASFAIHAGAEYRLPLFFGEMPLRIGYFNRPDPLPSTTAGAGSGAVSRFILPSVKQDVTGFTIGTGFTRTSASADLALQWLQVNTHTKLRLPGATAPVDSGDTRSTIGAVASFTLRFGPKAAD